MLCSIDHELHANTTQLQLLQLIRELNANPAIDGILIQLPLPAHIDKEAVFLTIDPGKDVDGFHPMNAGKLLISETIFQGGFKFEVDCNGLGEVFPAEFFYGEASALSATQSSLSADGIFTFIPLIFCMILDKMLYGLEHVPLYNFVEGREWECQPIPLQAPYGVLGVVRLPFFKL